MPNDLRIQEYEEPASGAIRESIEKEIAMQSMIAESVTKESGANEPAAATTGPIVEASEYAGPIEADASTMMSKNPSTFGSPRFAGSVRDSAIATTAPYV